MELNLAADLPSTSQVNAVTNAPPSLQEKTPIQPLNTRDSISSATPAATENAQNTPSCFSKIYTTLRDLFWSIIRCITCGKCGVAKENKPNTPPSTQPDVRSPHTETGMGSDIIVDLKKTEPKVITIDRENFCKKNHDLWI